MMILVSWGPDLAAVCRGNRFDRGELDGRKPWSSLYSRDRLGEVGIR